MIDNLFGMNNEYWRTWYGINSTTEFDALGNNIIVKIDNTGGYFTSDGTEIPTGDYSEVVGVRKFLGPYAQYQTDELEHGPTSDNRCDFHNYELSDQTLIAMMDFLEYHLFNLGTISTFIECPDNLADYDYVDNNGGNGDPWTDGNVLLMKKYRKWLTNTGSADDGVVVSDTNWEEFVSDFFSFNLPEYADPVLRYSDIAMNSAMFRIIRIGTDSNQVIFSGGGSEFVDSEGYPNIPSINFTPGFYKLTIFTPNIGLYETHFETKSTFSAGLAHKDYFQATIYPNPNTEDFYFADVHTTAKLKGRYEVFDGQGNLHYSYVFNLPDDHDGTHRIQPDVVLPDGFLYHKFTFADGSYETITTVKQ